MFFSWQHSVQLHNSTAVVTHFLQENDYIVKKSKQLPWIRDKKYQRFKIHPHFIKCIHKWLLLQSNTVLFRCVRIHNYQCPYLETGQLIWNGGSNFFLLIFYLFFISSGTHGYLIVRKQLMQQSMTMTISQKLTKRS